MTRYKSAVQKRNAAVLLRKPGRLASQYAVCHIYLHNNIKRANRFCCSITTSFCIWRTIIVYPCRLLCFLITSNLRNQLYYTKEAYFVRCSATTHDILHGIASDDEDNSFKICNNEELHSLNSEIIKKPSFVVLYNTQRITLYQRSPLLLSPMKD